MQSAGGTANGMGIDSAHTTCCMSLLRTLYLSYLFPFIYSTSLNASARPLHQAVNIKDLFRFKY